MHFFILSLIYRYVCVFLFCFFVYISFMYLYLYNFYYFNLFVSAPLYRDTGNHGAIEMVVLLLYYYSG